MVSRNQNLLSFKVGAGALNLRGLCLDVLCFSQRPGPENNTNPLSQVTKIGQSPSALSTLFTHQTSARSAGKELFSSSSAGEAFPFLLFLCSGQSGKEGIGEAFRHSIPRPVTVRRKKCRTCRSFQDSPRDQSYFSHTSLVHWTGAGGTERREEREREESVL